MPRLGCGGHSQKETIAMGALGLVGGYPVFIQAGAFHIGLQVTPMDPGLLHQLCGPGFSTGCEPLVHNVLFSMASHLLKVIYFLFLLFK